MKRVRCSPHSTSPSGSESESFQTRTQESLMAKKSSIEKDKRRRKMAKSFSGRRSRLKAIVMDKTKPMEERFAATLKLAELPRNSAKTRIHNRCEITGR